MSGDAAVKCTAIVCATVITLTVIAAAAWVSTIEERAAADIGGEFAENPCAILLLATMYEEPGNATREYVHCLNVTREAGY